MRTGWMRKLTACGVGVVLALTALSAAPAVADSAVAAAEPVDQTQPMTKLGSLGNYAMAQHDVPEADLRKVDAKLPAIGLTELFADTGSAKSMRNEHSAPGCGSSPSLPISPAAVPSTVWCWDSTDDQDGRWLPQGLTTSGEYDPDTGLYHNHRVIISAWVGSGGEINDHGELQIVDYDGQTPKYHTVYLAGIAHGGDTLQDVFAHLGGIVWVGDHLLFTSARWGDQTGKVAIYDLSLDQLRRVDTSAPPEGCPSLGYCPTDGKWRANGRQYVLLVTRTYTWQPPAGAPRNCGAQSLTERGFCFDGFSVDTSTTPYSLVGSEFVQDTGVGCDPAGDQDPSPSCAGMRVLRWSLNQPDKPDGLALDEDGLAVPTDGMLTHVSNIQSVNSYKGAYFYSRASGTRGQLWAQRLGGRAVNSCGQPGEIGCWAGDRPSPLGSGAEAVTRDVSHHLLWSQTECDRTDETCRFLGAKILFAVNEDDLPVPPTS